ncbi:sugar phosphate isomerase/epimerase family protein [Candidatus Halobonum tyrrellensis]|uniref:Xylose isomerase domain-containing protein n=1 Tax=Candidatus Halobonum tyrrellensis G22 TaxID=1324957 RepID=V4HBJ3_9EURY|nr:sugar phosphate isomerase/epimerase [Candidatus Halobonum tyrrellensis]ESP87413.1 xylose isomerase domain-containing protein [Candidatus Halobonum tyrrellensis G22]
MSDSAVGVQSVVFEATSLADLLAELAGTGIEHLELWTGHLSPDDGDERVAAAERALDTAGVAVCGYGVADLAAPDDARRYAAFADRLGAGYLTVNYPPARDDVTEALVSAAAEFDLDIAVHNYSSLHHDDRSAVFSSVADVRDVFDRYDHPRLGVCVDTGHFLVEDVDPETVVRDLGDRIAAVHLKDTSEAAAEDLPGAGRLDLSRLVGLLDAYADPDAPLVVEYELPAERATAALREAEANVRAALADATEGN